MIGIDVGGTKIELAIFDDCLELIDVWREQTPIESYIDFLTVIETMVAEADERLNSKGTVGVGIPGFVDGGGRSVSANVACLNGKQVEKDLTRRLSRIVRVDSDTKNFVVSEMLGGAAKNKPYALGIILGTGVSGNFGINGQLARGKCSRAGEFGHIPLAATVIEKHGFPILNCGCGLHGCVETYLSGSGLLWMSKHFGEEFFSTVELVKAVATGSPVARTTYAAYIDCLGSFFAQLSMIFDPDIIVLGGGVSNIKTLYHDVHQRIVAHSIKGFDAPNVVPATFGDSSGVRGAALLGSGRV